MTTPTKTISLSINQAGVLPFKEAQPHQPFSGNRLDWGRLVIIEDGQRFFDVTDVSELMDRFQRDVLPWTDWNAQDNDDDRRTGGLLICWPFRSTLEPSVPNRDTMVYRVLDLLTFYNRKRLHFQVHNAAFQPDVPVLKQQRGRLLFTDFVYNYDNIGKSFMEQINLVTAHAYGLSFVYDFTEYSVQVYPSQALTEDIGEVRYDPSTDKIRWIDEIVLLSGNREMLEVNAFRCNR